MTRIAIVGPGHMGSALARLWSEAGHEVSVAVREGSAPKSIPGVTTGPAKEIAGKAEIVVLAVPWPAVKDALASCGDLDGKILVDCTNPVLPTLEGLEFGGADLRLPDAGPRDDIAANAPRLVAIMPFCDTGRRLWKYTGVSARLRSLPCSLPFLPFPPARRPTTASRSW